MASLRYNHKLRTRVNKFRTLSSNGITGRLKQTNAQLPLPTPTPTPEPSLITIITTGEILVSFDGAIIETII